MRRLPAMASRVHAVVCLAGVPAHRCQIPTLLSSAAHPDDGNRHSPPIPSFTSPSRGPAVHHRIRSSQVARRRGPRRRLHRPSHLACADLNRQPPRP
ncbi:hypothetical protein ZWY2020_059329 [Hordeum vulgare]|nr:hypothetical protein ZWY2020_059329 [Hordeum vulgare]